MTSKLLTWLREQTRDWSPSTTGVFRLDAAHAWPLIASSPSDLEAKLTDLGHLLPLPTEPAALANVMEIELRTHLLEAAENLNGATAQAGTERSYPDLEFGGSAFDLGPSAVDIKCARRAQLKRSAPTKVQNRIALYTGNTYFLWPQLKFNGILRPFGDYRELLSVVVLYDFRPDLATRISAVEVLVHETWRIASRSRSSTTREYIGSVQELEQLRAGNGEFESADEFYAYWRDTARRWKSSPEAERLLRRALMDLSNS